MSREMFGGDEDDELLELASSVDGCLTPMGLGACAARVCN
jgi:hypothetical protein